MSFLYFAACAGMTAIICYGTILAQARAWCRAKSPWLGGLVTCPMCMGFHVGILLKLIVWASVAGPGWRQAPMMLLLYACASSIVSYIVCMVVGDDGIRFEKKVTS